MGYFEKLNKAWRDGIDAVILDSDGGERPDIADAFREVEGRHRLEVVIAHKPSKADLEEIGGSYVDFSQGWIAATTRTASALKKE